MTAQQISWGPTPNGMFHALEDPQAQPRRSLCSLRVECDDSLVTTSPVGRRCRSCLEKLEGEAMSGDRFSQPEFEIERIYEPDEDAMRRLLELLLRSESHPADEPPHRDAERRIRR